jgi:FkbM family methyltransferase
MISYAQAREDVLLHRALRDVPAGEGFYIDVGAYHPTIDSVTRHFYELGWRGINIEPGSSLFDAFVRDRPRDTNLHLAVSDHAGEVTFHEVEGQLGTLEEKFARRHAAAGLATRSYTVAAATLAQICERHAPIHFLKIDIEGHEAAALRGMDFKRFRPWILVIEAIEPTRLDAPTYAAWDGEVQNAGYRFAYTDILNRYYVAQEHAGLVGHFALGVDEYLQARFVNEVLTWHSRAVAAEDRLARLEAALAARSPA